MLRFREFLCESNGPKGKDLSLFVRFGGLDLKNQHGYHKKKLSTFHSPPAPRGIFAMPLVAQEMFLVSSIPVTQPGRFAKYPKEIELINSRIDVILKPHKLSILEDPSEMSDARRHMVKWHIGEDGFSELEALWKKRKKLEKEFNDGKKNRYREMRRVFKKVDGEVWHHLSDYVRPNEVLARRGSWVKTDMAAWRKAFSKCSVDLRAQSNKGKPAKGLFGYYSKDHLEVFFDEKV